MPHSLHKNERICRKKVIGEMFSGAAHSFSIFPLRVVYLPVADQPCHAAILVSVSKRKFKRAVKRNRVKRQVREAYRLNKELLLTPLQASGQKVAVAFIYLSDKLLPSSLIEERMKAALSRVAERTQCEQQSQPTETDTPEP